MVAFGACLRRLTLVALVAASVQAVEPPQDSTTPSPLPKGGSRGVTPAGKTVAFAPGVEIDWSARVVAVRAKVALRQGPLELLACTPQSREHESVLVVSARPAHIFQALGLLGAEPGQPPTYDDQTQRMTPSRGAAVSLSVRFGAGGDAREVPARELLQTHSGQVPTDLQWVFSGSRAMPDGGLSADTEGTVACVVDFPSALLSLDRSHSASNDQLWLTANTERIPPVGTECELLIRIEESPAVLISLDAQGRFRLDDRLIAAPAVAKIWVEKKSRSDVRIVAAGDSPPAPDVVAEAIRRLVTAGIDVGRIETTLPSSDQRE